MRAAAALMLGLATVLAAAEELRGGTVAKYEDCTQIFNWPCATTCLASMGARSSETLFCYTGNAADNNQQVSVSIASGRAGYDVAVTCNGNQIFTDTLEPNGHSSTSTNIPAGCNPGAVTVKNRDLIYDGVASISFSGM